MGTRVVTGLVSAALILGVPVARRAAAGDDAKAAAKGPTRPGDDQLKKVLAGAAEAIRAPAKEGAGAPLDFRSFANRLSPETKADALRAIGLAQARVGDAEGSARSWQDAVDAANEARDPEERSSALCRIAEAQAESTDRAEVLALLQQAMQAARLIKDDPDLPPPLRAMQGDAGTKRAKVLVRIAIAQAKAGDRAAAGKALRQAEAAAESIEGRIARAGALAEIAGATEPGMTRQVWAKAFEFASTLDDPWQAGRATETVLRARARSGGYEEALAMVRDGLKGDPASYGIWVVADEMAKAGSPAPADAIKRLLEMAGTAVFDRRDKREKVFTRIAEVQAESGDDEGAERTVGKLGSDDANRHFSFLMARAVVLSRIAKAQLKAGKKDAAKVTLRVALDIVAPFRGGDGDGAGLFPLGEISETLARAGEVASAIETAGAIPSGSSRVPALVAIAVIRAESGDRAGAATTLGLATRAADAIPGETLWTMGALLDNPWAIEQGSTYKAGALEAIAVARARSGDVPGALRALATTAAGPGAARRPASAGAIEEIALIQAKAGDYPGALKTIESHPGEEPFGDASKANALAKVARQQATSGDPGAALAWATTQPSPKAKAEILRSLAEGIAEARGPRKPAAPPASP